ncbi:MAG: UbiD family decarboxylase, partial [Thermodesulfobacteriota bacterium]|nr:UbiD family decarboxylase [Thermodesulfobacteriota bacterium]
MQNEYVRSLRTTLDFLLKEGEALLTDGQVDPICEIAGILKSFENGPAIIFNKIKGYPGIRNVGNLFARIEREARMFGVNNPGELKLKCRGALKNPLPASIVEEAPCQEVVIKDNFDVSKILPIIKHTNFDGARILGGGVVLAMGEYYNSGSDLSFKRLSFRDRDWASIAVERTSHLGVIRFTKHRKDHIPLTVNIGVPPSVMTVAAVLFPRTIVPIGSDEVGMAGALQEFPVELCRAKTVDAYAIAEAEWVLEGYYLPDRVWESEEAERLGKQGVAPLMPEWTRYMGKAYMHRKFQVTAITHRKDRPYFFTPLADSFETDNMALPWREACFLELADRIAPGLAVDVSVPYGLGWGSGVVFKVKKRGLA